MKGSRFTPEQRAEIARLYKDGQTYNQIARVLGRNPVSIRSVLERDGVIAPRRVKQKSSVVGLA